MSLTVGQLRLALFVVLPLWPAASVKLRPSAVNQTLASTAALPGEAVHALSQSRQSLRARRLGKNNASKFPFGCCDARNTTTTTTATIRPPDHTYFVTDGNFYYLQRAGLQKEGIPMPRSPRNKNARMCLTAGRPDNIDGLGLYWHTCQVLIEPPNIPDRMVQEAQKFAFATTGQIIGKGSNLCVRRMECKGDHVYDLGACDGPGRISQFMVKRTAEHDANQYVPVGTLAKVAEYDRCTVLCGPYIVLERCRSEGGPRNGAKGCGHNYKGDPGWTRGHGHYLGEEVSEGWIHRGPRRSLTTEMKELFLPPEEVRLSGLKATNDIGKCSSYVTDGPAVSSIFYLTKTA
eukprot:CAMPEP_0172722028 /NCGR_PEP_ID=MMETSP1074-20121228/80470_1 /TAXON_ID=2916 /ORGANISM="Ceratium fusus, Strain PA161109" /LENGTH=346 /DNA_ID=CAMNT_0013547925 /DNA_START=73 /DNA_END=1113 /DNA_ORIENTATION=-